MRKTKLFTLLRVLSKTEQNRFRKFVHSPFHNRHRDVRNLMDYLLDVAPALNNGYSKQKVYEHLFPKDKYIDTKIRNIISDLLKLGEDFVAYERYEEDGVQRDLYLMQDYRNRKQPKHFDGAFREARRRLSNSGRMDAEHYRQSFIMHREAYNFEGERQEGDENHLQELTNNLDIYYMAEKLRYTCSQLTYQTILGQQYSHGPITHILDYISQTPSALEIPAIKLYYYGYMTLTEPDTMSHFRQLKEEIIKNGHLFNVHELKGVYVLGINYCIRRLNTGGESILEELFDIYKSGLKHEVFIERGRISRFTYKNIATTGRKLGKLDWTREFIQEYAEFLDPIHRDNYENYNLGRWHQEKNEYKAAMDCFVTVHSSDLAITLDSKVALLKLYYQLDEFEALDYLLASFKTFIYRQKALSKYLKKGYLNFVKYTSKMNQLNPEDRRATSNLKTSIKKASQLPESAWFMEQLDNLRTDRAEALKQFEQSRT